MSMNTMYTGTPLVFGHRGASGYAPQNTLRAYQLAAEQGADGIELDVWLTRDGQLVIIHDFHVDHVAYQASGRVGEMTFAELRALDVGNHFYDHYDPARVERIPTLDEVFEAVGKRLYINVEIKSDEAMVQGVEAAVADCIRRHAMTDRVIISSFDPYVLGRFHEAMPQAAIGFLTYFTTPPEAYTFMEHLPHQALHPYREQVDAAYMERAHVAGKRVHVWTVNDPDEARRLRNLGVDLIMTDFPDTIRAALER